MTQSKAIELALTLCRGEYQRAIVLGKRNISGSDIKGRRAKKQAASYRASRITLLSRMVAAKIPWKIVMVNRKRELILGDWEPIRSCTHDDCAECFDLQLACYYSNRATIKKR